MCNNCENKSESGGSFIFGIVLGAIIGAVIAIYIYKNNRADIFDNLQKNLQKYFAKFMNPQPSTSASNPTRIIKTKSKSLQKIAVIIPKTVESLNLTPPRKTVRRKMFVKR